MTALVVRPRWARVVGAVWLAAGAALVLAGVVVVADQQRLGWEVPLGLVVAAVGWWCWQRHVAVDEHGIEQRVGLQRTRLLWGVVERVVVPDGHGLAGPVRVHLLDRGEVVLQASWGLSHRQRDELAKAVDRMAALAGVEADTPDR